MTVNSRKKVAISAAAMAVVFGAATLTGPALYAADAEMSANVLSKQMAKAAKKEVKKNIVYLDRSVKKQKLLMSRYTVVTDQTVGPNAITITRSPNASRVVFLQKSARAIDAGMEMTAVKAPRTLRFVREHAQRGNILKVVFPKGKNTVTVKDLPAGSEWKLQVVTKKPQRGASHEVFAYVGDPAAAAGNTARNKMTGEEMLGAVDLSYAHLRTHLNGGEDIGYRVIAEPADGLGKSVSALLNPVGLNARDDNPATTNIDEARNVVRLVGLDENVKGYVFTVQATNPSSVSEKLFRTTGDLSLAEIRDAGGSFDLTPIDRKPAGLEDGRVVDPGNPGPSGGATSAGGGTSSGGSSAPVPAPSKDVGRASERSTVSAGVYDEAAQTVTFDLSAPSGWIPGAMDSGLLPRVSWTGVDGSGKPGQLVLATPQNLINDVDRTRQAQARAQTTLDVALADLQLVKTEGVEMVDINGVTQTIYTYPSGKELSLKQAQSRVDVAEADLANYVSDVSVAEAALMIGQSTKIVFNHSTDVTSWSITEHYFNADGQRSDGATVVQTISAPPRVQSLLDAHKIGLYTECDLTNVNDPNRASDITIPGSLVGAYCVSNATTAGATGVGGSAGGGTTNGFVVVGTAVSPYTYYRATTPYTYHQVPSSYWGVVANNGPRTVTQQTGWDCPVMAPFITAQPPICASGDGVFTVIGTPVYGSVTVYDQPVYGNISTTVDVKNAAPAGWSDLGNGAYERQVKNTPPTGWMDNGSAYETVTYGINTNPGSVPAGYVVNPALLNVDGSPKAQTPGDFSWAQGAYVRPADTYSHFEVSINQATENVLAAQGISQIWVNGERWFAAGSGGGWVKSTTGDLGRCPIPKNTPTQKGFMAVFRGAAGSTTAELRPCN